MPEIQPQRPLPSARTPWFAAAWLALGLIGCTTYANLSFAVTNPANFEYFPPFKARFNANNNLKDGGILFQYCNIATSVFNGKGYAGQWDGWTGATSWKPPAFSTLLAGLFWVCDGDKRIALSILVFFQIASLFVTGLLVLAVVRPTAVFGSLLGSMVAALLFLTWVVGDFNYWFQCTSDYWLIMLALDLLMAGCLWFEPLGCKTAAAVWGACGGIMALVNPILGFTWFALSLAIALKPRAWLRLALAAACAGAAMSPWIVRNYLVFGRFIPVKSNLGYEFYQSQCLQAGGLVTAKTFFANHPGGPTNREGREYRQLGEMAYIDKKWEAFWKSVGDNPLDFGDRVVDRFVAATLYGQEDEPGANRHRFFWSRFIHPLPLIAALILLGSALWRPLSTTQWLVLGVYFIFLMPYVVISYFEPYGMPLVGVKVLLIVCALERVLTWRRPAVAEVVDQACADVKQASSASSLR